MIRFHYILISLAFFSVAPNSLLAQGNCPVARVSCDVPPGLDFGICRSEREKFCETRDKLNQCKAKAACCKADEAKTNPGVIACSKCSTCCKEQADAKEALLKIQKCYNDRANGTKFTPDLKFDKKCDQNIFDPNCSTSTGASPR